ncbi:hypothetical protein [Pseudomonas rhizosphaerae]|uniref:hypothetical protein n=1 Tax=Pseudomonas rhizosphaerae TaxID=216142 RepID=UPI002B486C1B|nr:hypothetical protein [Pseudomonas rhizosphaerae]MEB2870332.1 hypothetical protein [Pseudomonas rhizosphaerae]
MKGVPIDYFLNGRHFAFRRRELVPSTGHHVRFNGLYYRVETVDWIEDEGDDLKINVMLSKAPGQ